MALTPSTGLRVTTPRMDLIMQIMLMIDQAIEGAEEVSSYKLAEQIVELLEAQQTCEG